VTADTTTVFSYAVESNGGIGKLVSTINTQLYSGSECGTILSTEFGGSGPGEFDHTGAKIYVPLGVGDENGTCYSLQTYAISKTGLITFKGATDFDTAGRLRYLPTAPVSWRSACTPKERHLS
jgi:hypothetical protein